MNALDQVIAYFSPRAALRRSVARTALASYEAAKPSKQRKGSRDASSPDQLVERGAVQIKANARYLERNHDIAKGILRSLTNFVIGANGIGIEPQPKNPDGTINTEYAAKLKAAHKEWAKLPEVTQTFTWSQSQRIMFKTWVRDGEAFAQTLIGNVPLLKHGTRVPYSFEMFESDLVPMDFNDDRRNIRQGIERNAWGRRIAYHVYKNHPSEPRGFSLFQDLKRISADSVLQVASFERIGQLRGVSEFASIINRLEDLKDYEESERIAAKVAAALTAYVKRGEPEQYEAQVDSEGNPVPRDINLRPGTVIDNLAIGEEIGLIDTSRPNVNAVTWRQGQLKAVASGIGASYSTVSRDYDGSYSAQRQELVEQWINYAIMADDFVGMFVQPNYENFVMACHLSGVVPIPPGMTFEQANDCMFVAQSMPWIDPLKEALAWHQLVRDGFASEVEVARKRGRNPYELIEEIAEFRRKAKEKELVFTSDGAITENNGALQASIVSSNQSTQ